MNAVDAGAGGSASGPLAGQTVVVIGGSAGIGLETARQVRAAGGDVLLVARNAERLERAAKDVGTTHTAVFDASDPVRLEAFVRDLPDPVDHLMITAGQPAYTPFDDLDLNDAARAFGGRVAMMLGVARAGRDRLRPGGTLLFIGGTGGRRPALGMAPVGAVTAALPALTANLALEIAPVRINLIAPGFVDTPLSARLLGEQLDARRQQLRENLPIRRVVGPEDVAAMGVHLMLNTALTGATFDVDGGQQFIAD